ncbi:MAG: leucyl/phenylalanyl-tRNA--protein transferase [Spirochaetales bacterium]|jgi:leucyl/phenylalanyl-tRNA--protein transferase|nr:leucyl/phenylalanyl-tRNA--protein transferase [Spirochaetales bacterium]
MLAGDIPYIDERYRVRFPHPDPDDKYGIVLVGGNLSPGMLLSAYEQGVFPWYNEKEPILWWNPPLRSVLFPGELRLSGSMWKFIRKTKFSVTKNEAFEEVISACREMERPGQDGTWITEDIVTAYTRLHKLGYGCSYEVWNNDALAGGLYGLQMPGYFCGESMFSKKSNASKLALWHLYNDLLREEDFKLIDFQVTNPHSESLGAREIPRDEYLRIIGAG